MYRDDLLARYRATLQSIVDESEMYQIERVAADLERYTFEPVFLIEIPEFLRMTKDMVLSYVESLISFSDERVMSMGIKIEGPPETIIEHQLKMVVRNYQLLARLRADEAEAWDEIHELYEDDQ